VIKVTKPKKEIKQVLFTDEEKALMKNPSQRIPYTVETEPGIHCFENAVRPLTTFPDPTFENLESHEDVREYSLGYPVIRPPAVVERIREGFRINKSSPEDYPWIQEFKSHYDYLIVGGGVVGSCIANYLAERIKIKDGFRVGIIEKDLTFRRSNSTQFLGGLRTQFSLTENIDSGLFGADYLRLMNLNRPVPNDQDNAEGFFNLPSIKFHPLGNLTLVSEADYEKLEASHKTQKAVGAQTALLTKDHLKKRFPWLNTDGLGGGCLGLENEGWFDSWNFLQSIILRNKYLGVQYINGEMMFCKKHAIQKMEGDLFRNFEAHIFLNNTKMVYPIEYCNLIIAAAGQSGNIGRMAGIGTGRGPLYMDIPVEPRRGYIFEIRCPDGPVLDFPFVSDPSGLFIRRDGLMGHYLVGKLPSWDMEDKIPENIFGDVDPDYFDQEILPILQSRFAGMENYTLLSSRPVDFDCNYIDGSPVIGHHPIHPNILMATGFNGRGPMYAPAVARGIVELLLDDGYTTIDFSRFSFDRFLNHLETKEELYC